MNLDLKKIIEDSVWAPSGDNCQPWGFKISNDTIYLLNIPEKDTSLYNFKQIASYFSHGCIIENIKISASHLGYSVDVVLFPDAANENVVAKIDCKKSSVSPDQLYPYIRERVTNRKPYNNIKISNEQKSVLLNSISSFESVDLKLIEDAQKIKAVSTAVSTNEKIVLENQMLHDFLFKHITWTKLDDDVKKKFFIDTLELNKIQKLFFKFASRWKLLMFLNKISFSSLVSRSNADLYSTSSAIGIIKTRRNTKNDFVVSGRAMQRIWLEATKQQISIQPITGIIFLIQRIHSNETQNFSLAHTFLIRSAYDTIKSQFDVEGETISFMFRLGFADIPTARSLRLDPVIEH